MPSARSINLETELPRYGIGSQSVQWLNRRPRPTQIEYLDLIEPQGPLASSLLRPDGVVENQDRPLLYFINEARLAEPPQQQQQQINGLRRALACRGDRAYLAKIRPGTLDVVEVSLDDRTPEWKTYTADSPEAITFFTRLAMGTCEELPAGGEVDYLFKEIFNLVDKAATSIENLKVRKADVISLVGRVLFFRFLRDRGIIKEENLKRIAPGADTLARCFATAENTAATCAWLDKTFNGDFLPLTNDGSLEFFQAEAKSTGQKLFHHLTALLMGEEAPKKEGEDYQLRLELYSRSHAWGHLDYAHIPVGLLSQVYERLSWEWHPERSQNTAVHYTPRKIAATLVGEAFDGLKDAHAVRVLDPACGASVFLVLAFRRIYRELWEHSGERPGTAAIRRILENQLVGFDICDSALKLSALSLYLTAIELDPDPVPPEKLKFKALCKGRSAILYDWRRDEDKPEGPVVGSIGEHVGKRFDGQFDLILCNPPWTKIGKEYAKVSAEFDRISRAIVTSLDPEIGKTYKNQHNAPDLPFVWRSMQWCKPAGRIAMALPARTLFKQGKKAETTRKALFRLLEVNGIINCSNLRETQVWPDVRQPFMLLFGQNRRPGPQHRLHFISPHTDLHANSLGEMRIDSKSAQFVHLEQTFEEPWLWKTLAVGTNLDVEVVRKIRHACDKTLQEYWVGELQLSSSSGYSIKADSKPVDCSALKVFKDLRAGAKFRFLVDTSVLPQFDYSEAADSRIDTDDDAADPLRVYRGPLVLIKEYQGKYRDRGRALICDGDIAYSESFHGYSAHGAKHGHARVRYLQLFAHSLVWLYHALATSGKLGFERSTVDKLDIDNCPFFPFEKLDELQRAKVESLSTRLLKEDHTVFTEIDDFFGELYGLTSSDIEVIKDTLEVREPNDELGKRASEPPDSGKRKTERAEYRSRLESYLRPFFKVLGKQMAVTTWKPSENQTSPFVVFTLTSKGSPVPEPSELFRTQLIPLANQTGATQIIQEIEGGLVIAILNQYRYWTPSRARLLGAEILRNYMTVFED